LTGVIYARYSEGPRQTDQSIEGQVADCTAYAERNGIRLLDVYADRHISGKSVEGRDEFQRMICDAEAGLFDAVIVWKIDRFGRNRQDIAINKMRLKKAGVRLLYAEESVPDGPEGIILESVLEGLAEYYSADLRQKVLRGIRETAKKGQYCSSTMPIGYKRDDDRHVIVDPIEAEAVREAFRLHIAGATTAEIKQLFNDRGILTSRGKPVSSGTIYRMLRNERYTGHWELAGIPLDVEPIIDEATFLEASKHFKTSRNNAAGRAKVNYLLSCKCFCGYCGAMLNAEAGTGEAGKVYHYYKCGDKKRGKKCELKPIQMERLDDAVIDATVEKMLTGEVIDQLVVRILEIQEHDEAADPAAAYRKRLEANKKKQKNIITAIEEGAGKGLAKRLAELEAEEEEIDLEIQRLELKAPKLTEGVIRSWLNSFREGDVSDPDFRQKLVDTFIARIDVWNDHAIIYYNMQEKTAASKCSSTARLVDLSSWYSNTSIPLILPPFIIIYIDL